MRRTDIAAFVQRPWAEIEEAKLRFRAQSARATDADTSYSRTVELRSQFVARHGGGVDGEYRESDLQQHVAVKMLLTRVADVLGRR